MQLRDIELIVQEKLADPSAGESERATLTKIQDILYSTEVRPFPLPCLFSSAPSCIQTDFPSFASRVRVQEGFEVPDADLLAQEGGPGPEDETF